MATKPGKKVRFKVRNLFSKNKYKKFSKTKERPPLRKESEESITTLGDDDVEENKELNFDLKTTHTTVVKSQQQKRRSVKLDLGDLLYGGLGGQPDRETEPVSSGHMAAGSRREQGTRPGEDRDSDLRLVTKDDGEDTSLSDTETPEKVFSAEVHTDGNAENETQCDKNVKNSVNSDPENATQSQSGKEALSFSKKVEGKSKERKKKRKKVTFSPTSTKYIQLEASQETLDVYVVEEKTIKKKKSKKKKIRKRIRKAARLSWRYLMAGFQNMTLTTPFYFTTSTMESVYTPRPSYP
ncbi:Hypp2374 [Branchiostoma lanceolatum]|uniref:Hypp2374 protein n=1 Tax=Branchiostoma lanceolatum TaxID=7740 RepID=A0A8J9ZT23_BRALA|nr:Hypp2374 [Branchiostoma lanceolatum]